MPGDKHNLFYYYYYYYYQKENYYQETGKYIYKASFPDIQRKGAIRTH